MNEICFNKHIKQALINEGLFVYLFQAIKDHHAWANWVFVAAYYSALHYYYAFLILKGKSEAELPKRHRNYNDNVVGDGDLGMAKSNFYTNKNEITDAVGDDYSQLHDWSHDIRYDPSRYTLLGEAEARDAVKKLKRIKRVVANESGRLFELAGNKVILCELTSDDLYRWRGELSQREN